MAKTLEDKEAILDDRMQYGVVPTILVSEYGQLRIIVRDGLEDIIGNLAQTDGPGVKFEILFFVDDALHLVRGFVTETQTGQLDSVVGPLDWIRPIPKEVSDYIPIAIKRLQELIQANRDLAFDYLVEMLDARENIQDILSDMAMNDSRILDWFGPDLAFTFAAETLAFVSHQGIDVDSILDGALSTSALWKRSPRSFREGLAFITNMQELIDRGDDDV